MLVTDILCKLIACTLELAIAYVLAFERRKQIGIFGKIAWLSRRWDE
jgi:hypothetical protein